MKNILLFMGKCPKLTKIIVYKIARYKLRLKLSLPPFKNSIIFLNFFFNVNNNAKILQVCFCIVIYIVKKTIKKLIEYL